MLFRSTYDELTLRTAYENTARDDYLHVVLTDEEDVPDAMARLRTIYPNIMKLDYDNRRTKALSAVAAADAAEHKSETELFAEFYEKQNGQPMSEEQLSFSVRLMERLKEESV